MYCKIRSLEIRTKIFQQGRLKALRLTILLSIDAMIPKTALYSIVNPLWEGGLKMHVAAVGALCGNFRKDVRSDDGQHSSADSPQN